MDLTWIDVALRLGVAAGLSGLLGLEREYDGQDAGLRTHLLVALGSALFAVCSVGAFDAFIADPATTNVTVDVTRIAAYVAPGIGFIGGGAILKYGGRVTGITTAASLWTAAAIGVSAGLGFWPAAVAATVFALIALELFKPLSDLAERVGRRRRASLTVRLDPDVDVTIIANALRVFDEFDVRELRYGVGPGDDRYIAVTVWRAADRLTDADVVARLLALDGVRSVGADGAA